MDLANNNLLRILSSFSGLRVLVVGEAMLDSYIKGTTDHLCREAPVPVVVVKENEDVPGGAANTAVNVHHLGGQVDFLSVVGDDYEGKVLLGMLERHGITTQHVLVQPDRATLAKKRIIASTQMMVRYDQGTTTPIDSASEQRLIEIMTELFPISDAVIISDYAYGIITPGIVHTLTDLQKKNPHIIVADSKELSTYNGLHLTAVKPNYSEALRLLQLERVTTPERIDQINQHGEAILEKTNAQIAAITLDEDGAIVFERDRPFYRTYAKAAPHTRAAGAGDTFVSAFTLALAAGADTPAAAEIASAAASIVVQKPGTSICSWEELRDSFYGDEKIISDVFYLAARVATYRRQGKKIVFTNGCFDILHRGHITYLNQAKSYGDILILGLNSDRSVRRLKGKGRPINTLEDRSQILAAMSCVDHIIPFDADTPHDLIRIVQPDIFVKGGDYTLETLPEASLVLSLGGQVQLLPYVEDRSTTGMIERIRKIYSEKNTS
ncbi:MAG TPA: D-glycero-beta-D-manno-heptose 1-phosphate adenylyltransferase [Anaerolineaceae bacterium]|nr:D-glycero-beta-D-manno-heptose 1-phosphate adenylyltransferase [Anaerolineaceae bacterium]